MTIADQLNSIANTKTAIRNAIIAKGVDMSGNIPFATYPSKISAITSSGGGGTTINAPFANITMATLVEVVDMVDVGQFNLTQNIPNISVSLVVS